MSHDTDESLAGELALSILSTPPEDGTDGTGMTTGYLETSVVSSYVPNGLCMTGVENGFIRTKKTYCMWRQPGWETQEERFHREHC
jgi:hypothetical protein